MTLAPEEFAHETLPAQGQHVRFHRQQGDLAGTGVVTLVWLGIEVCVEIDVDGGGHVGIHQALGDTWEPTP